MHSGVDGSMEEAERTLVVFLTMHRSGSSLTAGTFQRLGLSLGPFELAGASPNNPHGHFEAVPFMLLNVEAQELVFGFRDDLPESDEAVTRFLLSQGTPDWPEIPQELLDRGKCLVEALIGSGKISGFKDPRTVLLWPFWQRVLASFPSLRIAPVALLRSPHEIAMSLFARRDGDCGYWSCLDVAAVHFRRLEAILEEWSEPVPRVRFGGLEFFNDLEQATRWCGLEWDHLKALRMFDGSCVHQVPAAVDHPAQQIYERLRGLEPRAGRPDSNAAQLETDARARDNLLFKRIRQSNELAVHLNGQMAELREHLNQAIEQMNFSAEQARQASNQFRETSAQLEHSRSELLMLKQQYEAHLHAARREEQRLLEICEDQRQTIEKYQGHPILGPALRGRWWLKRTVHSLTSSSAS